jgi:hypothetical protein
MEAIVEALARPHTVSGLHHDIPRHGATYGDRLVLGGPVSPQPLWQPPVDLRAWWREQAMLELGMGRLGYWTREGTMRGGAFPIRGKVRR